MRVGYSPADGGVQWKPLDGYKSSETVIAGPVVICCQTVANVDGARAHICTVVDQVLDNVEMAVLAGIMERRREAVESIVRSARLVGVFVFGGMIPAVDQCPSRLIGVFLCEDVFKGRNDTTAGALSDGAPRKPFVQAPCQGTARELVDLRKPGDAGCIGQIRCHRKEQFGGKLFEGRHIWEGGVSRSFAVDNFPSVVMTIAQREDEEGVDLST